MDDDRNEKRVIIIDPLADEFLEAVNTAVPGTLHDDGTVEIGCLGLMTRADENC